MVGKKIFVAGHRGMVGSAMLRRLADSSENELITAPRQELDLTDQHAVAKFFQQARPDLVVLAAAKVGGIHANSTYPADFIYENLIIQCNVIHQAFRAGVEELLLLGSSCIYPREASNPIEESSLLTGRLEPTNEPYAVAKIAGLKLCESYNRQYGVDYRSVMPCNLYGPGDNFHIENSHVLPAFIRRFHEAAIGNQDSVSIWGSGLVRREFLHVDDMADASTFILNLPKKTYESNTGPMLSHINIGSGTDISVMDLARLVAEITGFRGEIVPDLTRPEGTERKLLDVGRLNRMGWRSAIDLRFGISSTYEWYLDNLEGFRQR